ncbi:putative NADPH-dependent methylglyoxal reductase [Triangularia verruculosa]|uniref:NADPH-dependent methylglyoxal reductase n=1 Tax=Triangularia verruculosa TaxID=2587418 RepID=A0AAN6XBX1_9PEZI|nr:putative NADPH-dependent methylglyoxal reductase [Triangularia verruculosa]
MAWPTYILVTGAAGFIGAHVVDTLLSRGFRDNEAELILPAINGVKAVLSAAARAGTVQRVVITSSFAAVLDVDRVQKATKYFTYTAGDWNPLTYEEAANAERSAVVAYRGSKKFAELAAWEFVNNFGGPEGRSSFDIVTLCPPMTFGPVVHPVVGGPLGLNDSNGQLWKVAIALQEGKGLPAARVPFWVEVRDLAEAHVEALLRPEAGGKRYLSEFPDFRGWGGEEVRTQIVDESHGIDGETASKELGIRYRAFRETVIDLMRQAAAM